MGVLTEAIVIPYINNEMFPSPIEETGGYYIEDWHRIDKRKHGFRPLSRRLGGLTKQNLENTFDEKQFPYPPEVTEGSYQQSLQQMLNHQRFRTLSRRRGFLTDKTIAVINEMKGLFPPPHEVAGVSYLIGMLASWQESLKFPPPLKVTGVSYQRRI